MAKETVDFPLGCLQGGVQHTSSFADQLPDDAASDGPALACPSLPGPISIPWLPSDASTAPPHRHDSPSLPGSRAREGLSPSAGRMGVGRRESRSATEIRRTSSSARGAANEPCGQSPSSPAAAARDAARNSLPLEPWPRWLTRCLSGTMGLVIEPRGAKRAVLCTDAAASMRLRSEAWKAWEGAENVDEQEQTDFLPPWGNSGANVWFL